MFDRRAILEQDPRRRRWPPLRVWVVLIATSLFWSGCTAEKKYRVLSFFFDGVPDPNAPKVTATRFDEGNSRGQLRAAIVSTHKPFAENKCNACHQGGPEAAFESSAVNSNMCMDCHKETPRRFAVMHAPVAAKACLWCHNPHESPSIALLREPSPAVCIQCHDRTLLGPKPPEHLQADAQCLACHMGHGGAKQYFLRDNVALSPPATARSGGGSP